MKPPVGNRRPRAGFTLIELLVVVTIIVILLALLTPALDGAIYQAELALCAANQNGMAAGVTAYAADHKRRYPYRATAEENDKPANLFANGPYDDRKLLRPYMSMKLLSEPLAAKVNYDLPDAGGAIIWTGYSLWAGWGYFQQSFAGGLATNGKGGERIMRKLGDSFTFNGQSFSALISDYDLISLGDGLAHGAHPDSRYGDGILNLTRAETADGSANSWWTSLYSGGSTGYKRNPIDSNYALQDGAVLRNVRVTWSEGVDASGAPGERIARIAEYPLQDGQPVSARWMHVPMR